MFQFFRSFGLKEISLGDYRDIYNTFGGSLLMDPDFLLSLNEIVPLKTKYFSLSKEGNPVLGVPVWGDYLAGERKALKRTKLSNFVDLGRPSIILPVNPHGEFNVRFKTNYLMQSENIANAKVLNNRHMALFKDYRTEGLSKRYKKDLRRYWRCFNDNGGYVKDISELPPDEVAHIFRNLHFKRWGFYPPANDYLESSFKALHQFMFGSVLFLSDEPVSIQIIYNSINCRYSNFEYINSGVDKDKSTNKLNLGSLLMDLNTSKADEIASENNTELIYSFGLYNVPYKERWCKQQQLYSLGLL